ncbi:hypothetical protein SLS63_012026 [Diaporthe eres]|uniref:2EXR domain-containing protein n=1 Tax=Diaporthe eres TaxID=83184 RepID=A0ABR1NSM8_DIAER
MSGIFHRFQALPWELQLMVFEEFILATKKPRIALLDVEDVDLGIPDDPDFPAWRIRIDNPEQLHAEKPTVVARSLLGVSSASRHVATRFLDRPDHTWDPPYCHHLPAELGLSVERDVFWVPDDLPQDMKTRSGGPAGHGRSEEDDMEFVMISLDTFERHFQWGTNQLWEDREEIRGSEIGRRSVLRKFFWTYPRSRHLIIMVDVPRGHVSWDQIQVVGSNDPTPYTMRDEDGPARCHSALENYVALQSDYMRITARELDTHITLGLDYEFDPEYRWTQPWPELSFAFLRPS